MATNKMDVLKESNVPKRLKFARRSINLMMYSDLIKTTSTCKTGGFFYAMDSSWLNFAVATKHYPRGVLTRVNARCTSAFVYPEEFAMYSVVVPESKFVSVADVDPEKMYPGKILVVDTREDVATFTEKFIDQEFVAGVDGCHVDWATMKKKFSGIEVHVSSFDFEDDELDQPENRWIEFWVARSGVVWDFGVISKLKLVGGDSVVVEHKVPDNFFAFSTKKDLDFGKFVADGGVQIYGGGCLLSGPPMFSHWLRLSRLPKSIDGKVTKSEIALAKRDGYPGVISKLDLVGLLWDLDSIVHVESGTTIEF